MWAGRANGTEFVVVVPIFFSHLRLTFIIGCCIGRGEQEVSKNGRKNEALEVGQAR
jgi:hypothetical protein